MLIHWTWLVGNQMTIPIVLMKIVIVLLSDSQQDPCTVGGCQLGP